MALLGPPVIPNAGFGQSHAEWATFIAESLRLSPFVARTPWPAIYGPAIDWRPGVGHVVAVHVQGCWRYAHLVPPHVVTAVIATDDAVRMAAGLPAMSRLRRQLE
jgi:hypothetical protein